MPRRRSTTPRRAPTQRRAVETVDVLLAATEKVLVEHGFARATTNRIAAVAGVSVGSLYHYFPTLEAMIEAVVHRMWQGEFDACEAALAIASPFEDRVRRAIAALVEHVRQRRVLYKRWYAEAPHLGQLDVGLVLAQQGIEQFAAVLDAHRDKLRVVDVTFAADFCIKVLLASVRTAARDYPTQLESGELSQMLSDLILRWLVR